MRCNSALDPRSGGVSAMFKRILLIGIVVVGALFLAMQLLPYGRQHAITRGQRAPMARPRR